MSLHNTLDFNLSLSASFIRTFDKHAWKTTLIMALTETLKVNVPLTQVKDWAGRVLWRHVCEFRIAVVIFTIRASDGSGSDIESLPDLDEFLASSWLHPAVGGLCMYRFCCRSTPVFPCRLYILLWTSPLQPFIVDDQSDSGYQPHQAISQGPERRR